ncbi:MAG: hypothetical protein ACOC58_05475 [Chloroflexota bacterium]
MSESLRSAERVTNQPRSKWAWYEFFKALGLGPGEEEALTQALTEVVDNRWGAGPVLAEEDGGIQSGPGDAWHNLNAKVGMSSISSRMAVLQCIGGVEGLQELAERWAALNYVRIVRDPGAEWPEDHYLMESFLIAMDIGVRIERWWKRREREKKVEAARQ